MAQEQDQPVIRIGELLVRSSVITAYDLSEAEKLSSHMKVQFGRLLIMAGCLTEEALECALEAQALIKDGLLNAEIACEALSFAVQENIPLRQALEMLDCLPQFGTSTLRLAELIHDANIIEEEKLHDAFDTSMERNRPLPEVLVEMQCISPGLLSIMLRMQEQIRNETLDREDAINELKGTFKIWKRADKAMANDPMSKSAIVSAAPPLKPSRYTSSFDSVTRLPAMSPEILANLNASDDMDEMDEIDDYPPPAAAQSNAGSAIQAAAQLAASGRATPPPSPAPALQAPSQPTSLPPLQPMARPANPLSPPAGITNGAPQAAPRAARGKDDWIMQDFDNAPAGQPMPDGVILYSQGYFPPDGQKNSEEESFADGFSAEDEQRINELLDVFASDVSPEPDAGDGSNSASDWLAAADGWGVPDLAAAGANLTGAEMFAKAQADLSSSGWSYSQANSQSISQTNRTAPAPVARTGGPAEPPRPAVPPGPLGQPLYVTPAPPLPTKGLGHPDFRPVDGVKPPDAPVIRRLDPESRTGTVPAISNAVPEPQQSLFSPNLKDSISDALIGNPFNIRRTGGGDSGASVPAISSPLSEPPHATSLEDVQAKDKSADFAEQVPQSKHEQDNEKDKPEEIKPEQAEAKDKPEEIKPEQEEAKDKPEEAKSEQEEANDRPEEARSEQEEAKDKSEEAKSEQAEAKDKPEEIKPEQEEAKDKPEEAGSEQEEAKDKPEEARSEQEEAKDKPEEARSEQEEAKDKPEEAKPELKQQEPQAKDKPEEPKSEPTGEPVAKPAFKLDLSSLKKDDDKPSTDLVDMLEAAQFFSSDELGEAILKGLKDQSTAAEIIGLLGIIDKSNLDAAVRLQKLVKAGSVDAKKAIVSLEDLRSGKIRPAELTDQLGIKKSKRRK